jgi:hypothetical protein
MSREEERVLLFKNPAGGDLYAQALLTVLCAPPGMTIKLTTYRRVWVPESVFTNPKNLENHKALMICVDAERDKSNKWWVKNFYPIREVNIKKSEIEGDYLALWVEPQGYVVCNDYEKYTDDLKKSLSRYPPDEKSYVVHDSIRNLQIVDPKDSDRTLSVWQDLVETLARLKAFERAAFFTLTKVSSKKDGKIMNLEKTGLSDPSVAYKFVQHKDYVLTFMHLLPFHDQREKLGRLEIELHSPSGVESDRDFFEIFGRHYSHNVTVKFRTKAFGDCSTIEASPKDRSFKRAPILTIPVKFTPRPLWRRLVRNLGLLVASCFAIFFYIYGQLIQATKSYPTLETFMTISPELIGAAVSSLTLVAIPVFISLMIGGKTQE